MCIRDSIRVYWSIFIVILSADDVLDMLLCLEFVDELIQIENGQKIQLPPLTVRDTYCCIKK